MTVFTDIKDDLNDLDDDLNIKDRGQMYMRVHAEINSQSSVVEGNVSTFSGLVGGTAFIANYVLADRSQHGSASYDYDMTIVSGSNDIYRMSQLVAASYIDAVIADDALSDGNLTLGEGLDAAELVWTNEGYEDQFPGNLFTLTDNFSLGVWALPTASTTEGEAAALAGAAGSVLFGKSVDDFSGVSGYAVLNGPDSANDDLFGIQRYVLNYNTANVGATSMMAGDRNDDGILNYDDGVVVMLESEQLSATSTEWYTGVNTLLQVNSVANANFKFTYTLDWDAYRAWNLMSDFRAQLVEGGEYDFIKYAEDNGTGAEKDFWAYTETLLNDSSGVVRNAVLYYDRVENGTSADNHLYGGSGQDALSGGGGADIIRAGWNSDQLLGGDGADELYGERDNDRLVGGEGEDILDGGKGVDTADYSFDIDGITVSSISPTGNGSITDGWGDTDTLISIEHIKGSVYDDTFTLGTATGLSIDGNGGDDVVSYTDFEFIEKRSDGAVLVYDDTGSNRDTIVNAQVDSYRGRIVIDDTQGEDLSSPSNTLSRTTFDYSAASGPAAFVFDVSAIVDPGSFGGFDVEYHESVSVTLATGITHTGVLANASAVDLSAFDVTQFILGKGVAYFQGTNYGDTFTIQGDGRTPVVLEMGSGNDTVFLDAHTGGSFIVYRGGDDIIYAEEDGGIFHVPQISFANGITPDQVTVDYDGTSLYVEIDGYGTLFVDNFDGSELNFAGGASITFTGTTPVVHNVTDNDVVITGTWGDDIWADHGVWDEDYYAYGGNDTINGSTGNNTLFGGDGNDTYVYDGLGGDSILIDHAGTDVIHVTDDTIHQENLFYEQDGDDLIVSFSNGTNYDGTPAFSGTMTIAGFYGDHGSTINTLRLADGSTDIDLMNPSSLDFYLIGTASANTLSAFSFGNSFIYGVGGNDTIDGGAGNDTLYGGDGDDLIFAGNGDDVLDGGAGTNELSGDAGNDTYVLSDTAYNTVDDSTGANRIITDENPTEEYDISDGLILKDAFDNPYAQINGSFSTITFADLSVLSIDDIYNDHIVYYQTSEDADEIAPQENGTFGDFSIDLLGGDDEYRGGSATDIVDGGYGFDLLQGGDGDDILRGGADGDELSGNEGNDTLDGGRDEDIVNYANDYSATSGVTVNLSLGLTTNDGFGNVDTLISIEDVLASFDDDDITGSSVANVLLALDGNDVLNGLGGNDYLDGDDGDDLLDGGDGDDEIIGGDDTDTVTYVSASSAVTVSLANTSAQNTVGAGTDTISGVEHITGSDYNDTLGGNAGNNTIDGGDGANDKVSYAAAGSAVTVNLSTSGAQNTVGAGTDTLINIESIIGSAYNDTLTGDSGDNEIEGGAGNDTLNGGGGINTISCVHATSGVIVDLYWSAMATGASIGTDTLANFQNAIGSAYDDDLEGNSLTANIIYGGTGNDILYGGSYIGIHDELYGEQGDDYIYISNGIVDGGDGVDTLTTILYTVAVNVDLSLTTGQTNGTFGTYTALNFENLETGNGNDTLTGNSSANVLSAGSGSDAIYGAAGDDTIYGGSGSDMLSGQAGIDTLYGEGGADIFAFEVSTAFSEQDTIADFDAGSGDAIDIHSLLVDFDELTSAITDFVTFNTSGSDSIMSVDRDGTAGTYSAQAIALISGVTGLDADDLLSNGHLLAA